MILAEGVTAFAYCKLYFLHNIVYPCSFHLPNDYILYFTKKLH